MAAVPNLPFYSTSYGDNFGYNERDGSNTASFRNRYWNQSFRGTAQLGPVRFQGQRSAAEHDLPHLNVTRPQTAGQTMARTQPMPMVEQTMSETARQPLYHPESESYAARAAAQTVQPRSWEQEHNRTSRFEQQAAAQRQGREERFDGAASYAAAPTGVYTAPVQQQQSQSVFARSAGPQYSQRVAQPFEPAQSLQQARLQQHAVFGDSVSARYALPSPNAAPSVNASPYYIPPYEAPPSSSFAPSARALGNKTYEFDLDDPSRYAFTASFRNVSGPVSSKPAQDAGQSIPYGRLQADDAREVRHKMALSSWDTFNVAERDASSTFNLAGIASKRKAGVDPDKYCKWSISQRLPVGEQLRYQIPGYCGFVPTEKLRHGSTYGKTTRMALAGTPEGM